MGDLRSLVAAVDADPSSAPKLALADWCGENGQPDAEAGLRWCVRRGKWPRRLTRPRMMTKWVWDANAIHNNGYPQQVMPRGASGLPMAIYDTLRFYKWPNARSWLVAVRRLGWCLRRLRELVN